MQRREFIGLIGGAAASPLAAAAQQKSMPVIGFLSPGPPEAGGPLLGGFRLGLSEAGYTEGQTVAIEYHWVEANERLAATAGDLVGRKVDLIVAITDPVARSTQTASSTTPIVFFIGGDPVANGLVASLARPGANLTGVTVFGDELNPKRLELACELVPDAKVIALLINPNNPSRAVSAKSADMQQAARSKAVQLRIVNATSESEIDAAFASLAELQARALIIDTDLFLFGQRAQIGALAARHSVPAIYYRREFVAAGGLISYGPSFAAAYRQAGIYAGKVLGGTKPADLPVLQPTNFELIINTKAAKALGLAVPQALLARADEVIE
ncbi:ABC transporter substrate-binding protein [Bradyrhizobium sp. LLZ17]|uniref:ABC transporter substrate-binding protein n=1 Tax=Bradyrhizobium sp. LLZ17 TaxID=3239388 RepID=A0AB39XR80_9BRAD